MKHVVIVLSVLSAVSSSASAVDPEDERRLAKAARQILDAWHHDQPDPGQRYVHLVCWTPSDREFPADYQARLTRIMQHIQEFYLREMEHFGFEGRTIGLQFDEEKLRLHLVKGQHPTDHYAVQSGGEIRRECLPVLREAGIDPERETIMIMCNLATWDKTKLQFTHKSPYYAAGSWQSGTAWQLDSPELDSRNLNLTSPIIRDGQYGRISLGKHNSIFIGGVAHELGHALGLPHCAARPDEAVRGTALMGSGNRTYGDQIRGDGRGSFLTLAHALRLASHPQFSGSVRGLRQNAKVSMKDPAFVTDGKVIKISGVVSGDPPVYAVVAYFDPDGGGDYDATTATAVPAADGGFTLRSNALKSGRGGEVRLFPLHANGSAGDQMSSTNLRYSYKVASDGTPDLSTIQTRQALVPLLAALADGNREQAQKLAAGIRSAKASAVAAQLIRARRPTQTPAEYESDSATASLTSFKPDSVKVGWARPTFNRIPDDTVLLESGGQIFETGIYAHAPARHTYQLGGKWHSLTGKAGLAAGHSGSVQFEIKGDGRTLWKSGVVRPGNAITFEVTVDDLQELELLTHPTNDGPGSDWALWLTPVLTR